mmetsp:Transcript_21760/g.54863  ORF Transcript_21760/g.54863 Transcript_21760/m.54863 type:complete len:279 (+) Transcript_21760:358-1194(+)
MSSFSISFRRLLATTRAAASALRIVVLLVVDPGVLLHRGFRDLILHPRCVVVGFSIRGVQCRHLCPVLVVFLEVTVALRLRHPHARHRFVRMVLVIWGEAEQSRACHWPRSTAPRLCGPRSQVACRPTRRVFALPRRQRHLAAHFADTAPGVLAVAGNVATCLVLPCVLLAGAMPCRPVRTHQAACRDARLPIFCASDWHVVSPPGKTGVLPHCVMLWIRHLDVRCVVSHFFVRDSGRRVAKLSGCRRVPHAFHGTNVPHAFWCHFLRSDQPSSKRSR